MPRDTTVRAPYNFVPFSNKILRYEGAPPAHDAVDPSLRTGEIRVTLTADTPVFVSDGAKDAHFFRGPDGTLQIPGSTIRGMIRQNMQILGFGLVRVGEDMEEQQFFYRKIACANDSVFYGLKTHYHDVLQIKSTRQRAAPESVRGGFLRKAGDRYIIQPVKGTVLRVSRRHPDVQDFGTEPSRSFPVSYTARGGRVERIRRGTVPGMAHGWLLYTGRPVGKPNPLYLFPAADESLQPVLLEKDALINATDLELRKNFLRGGGHDPAFWDLPRAGEEKPVFYARWDGHTYFGMSLFLRLRYLNTLSKGLPEAHRDKPADFLDWPRAILGWAGEETSCRSRVSFGDFPAQGSPEEQAPVRTVLGAPKPGYFPSYLKDGKHYDEEGFRLCGYKHYWLKDAQAVSTDHERVGTALRPLPAGTRFTGNIRYKNLRPEELGLLLWAIRLEEGCFQSVGMGKPYGFGRMRVSIDGLWELDLPGLYRPEGLCAGPAAAPEGAVQRYIDAYDAAAAKGLYLKKPKKRPSITSVEEIRDFFYMKRTLRAAEEVRYMSLPEHQNAARSLPDVGTLRQEAEKAQEVQDFSRQALARRLNNKI